jgi:hypothetical protein
MIFEIIGIIAVLALVIFIIKYYKGHYKWDYYNKINEKEEDKIFDSPIELISKTKVFMDLPPIEAAVAVEFLNKHIIPLKYNGKIYLTLFGQYKELNHKDFVMINDPYEIIVDHNYSEIWKSLTSFPKYKNNCTHILIGKSVFKSETYFIEIAELQTVESIKRENLN